jgi:alpha-beta hydrolase superfamily lysophospholipase
MFKRSEAFFEGFNRTRLFYQIWEPAQVRGHLIITHGQAEHSGCYQRLVDGLQDLSYAVYAWDLRGHGRSDGQRGYAHSFQDYVRDFEFFLQALRNQSNLYPKDLVVLGHSMGGLIQLETLLANPQWDFQAQVLSSPMLGVAIEVPLYKDLAALALSKLLPTVTLKNEINYSDLTRDPDVIKEYEADFLRHDRISAGAYLGAVTAIEMIRSKMSQIRVPTLWQMPENDPIVGSQTSKELFQKLGTSKKVLKIYPDRKHEIYNDLGRDEVFRDIVQFLQMNLSS